jgi:RND family efflux transporter MFP subunit
MPPLVPVLFELQALALREPRFDAAAATVLMHLASRLGAMRVTLAARRSDSRSARIIATSEGIDNDRRLQAQRRLMNAADEAMDRNAPIEAPQPPFAIQALPAVALAHLLRPGEVNAVLGVAFELDHGQRGALIVELRESAQREQRMLARDAALFVGPILMLKARLDAPLSERVMQTLRPYDEQQRRAVMSKPLMVTAGVAAALLLVSMWPMTHHVVAQARIEGQGQRVVPAPMDGFLQSVSVRPGETVKKGQLLAVLDDRESGLQAERSGAERQQLERQYLDALSREDAAATEIARAKFEQAKAQDELAQSRLSLSRLLAPFDGVLISGDLISQVGTPVRRGQELMVVAPSKTWRVVAEVDEHDIAYVKTGQQARVLLAALAGTSAEFTVARVSPVAQPLDGKNVFEVEGIVQNATSELRPGIRGVARIEAGEQAPLFVWWERASNAVRRVLWALMS